MDKATMFALAQQAGWDEHHCLYDLRIERFYNLIHDHLTYSSIHSCHPGCTKPACVAMRKAVEAEREVCAQIAKQWDIDHPSSNYGGCIAAAIRSRT